MSQRKEKEPKIHTGNSQFQNQPSLVCSRTLATLLHILANYIWRKLYAIKQMTNSNFNCPKHII